MSALDELKRIQQSTPSASPASLSQRLASVAKSLEREIEVLSSQAKNRESEAWYGKRLDKLISAIEAMAQPKDYSAELAAATKAIGVVAVQINAAMTAFAKIERAETNVAFDIGPIVKALGNKDLIAAIEANTEAVETMAAVVSAPKEVTFDRAGNPTGIKPVRAN